MVATPSYEDRLAAARLLHRFNFGPTPGQYANLVAHGLPTVRERVLTHGVTDPGINSVPHLNLPDMATYPDTTSAQNTRYWNRVEKDASDQIMWWLDRMVAADHPLTERMTWFWHGHWATSISTVTFPLTMQRQNETLRTHALGNFRDMAKAMVLDGALNVWLNNNENYIAAPNENLAREFMELMTIGVGHYSQDDVKAAALALTGYETNATNGAVTLHPSLHFSVPLKILGNYQSYDALKFAEVAVATDFNPAYIAERLWFRFVSASTKPPASLAQSFESRNIFSLVSALVESPAWTDPANSLVKSPVEWFVGACRAMRVRPSSLDPGDTQYLLSQMGQLPFNPPNVGGWTFGESWLNGVAYQYRFQLASNILAKADLAPLDVQPLEMVQACADWLGVPQWSRRTANALTLAVSTPSEMALAALLSPEYMVSA